VIRSARCTGRARAGRGGVLEPAAASRQRSKAAIHKSPTGRTRWRGKSSPRTPQCSRPRRWNHCRVARAPAAPAKNHSPLHHVGNVVARVAGAAASLGGGIVGVGGGGEPAHRRGARAQHVQGALPRRLGAGCFARHREGGERRGAKSASRPARCAARLGCAVDRCGVHRVEGSVCVGPVPGARARPGYEHLSVGGDAG